jgi:hypothetical protein
MMPMICTPRTAAGLALGCEDEVAFCGKLRRCVQAVPFRRVSLKVALHRL